MKSRYLSAAAILFLTPVLAFAKTKNSADVQLDQTVTVGGTQLAPGKYEVTWQGTGPDLKVSFTQGAKTVATASAMLVSNPPQDEAIVTQTAADHTTTLQAIDRNHFTIEFQPSGAEAGD